MLHDVSQNSDCSSTHGCGCSGRTFAAQPVQMATTQTGGGVAVGNADQTTKTPAAGGCCGSGNATTTISNPANLVQLQDMVMKPVENTTSPRLWRSIEEYERDPDFLAKAEKEFAPGAEWWVDQPSRRAFLKGMGASFALAGLTGCTIRQPEEKIVPYVTTPEDFIPGKPQFYATAMPQPGGAIGLLAESHDGRPTRVEGNPQHPSSGGAADSFAIASILSLYDPLRVQSVKKKGVVRSWTDLEQELSPIFAAHRAQGGSGLGLLLEEVISPTLHSQLQQLVKLLPNIALYQHNAWQTPGEVEGSRLAFGQPLTAKYQLSNADVIFSVGNDFLSDGSSHLRLTKEFTERRVVNADGSANMNRLYVVETSPTQTGSKADHWLRLSPNDVTAIILGVAKELGLNAGGDSQIARVQEAHGKFISVLASDLKAAGSRAVVLAGADQPREIHALVHLINQNLGSVGETVIYHKPVGLVEGVNQQSLIELANHIADGALKTLVILANDPVFTAPKSLKLDEKLAAVPLSIYHSLNSDETSKACTWQTPATHYLEEWSDTRAADGTVSIVQPLIRPMYDGRSAHEILNMLVGDSTKGYETVRATWRSRFETAGPMAWEKVLHDGFIPDTAFAAESTTIATDALSELQGLFNVAPVASTDFTIEFKLDPSIFDGRYATNGWLQEVPRPLSKVTWGNAAWISKKTADELGVKIRDNITIQRGDVSIEVPVFIQPGQPHKVITLFLGNGRQIEGHTTVGVDVSPLRDTTTGVVVNATVKRAGTKTPIARTQEEFGMHGRHLVRFGDVTEVQEHPEKPHFMDVGHHHGPVHEDTHNAAHGGREGKSYGEEPGATFFPEWPKDQDPQWGMTINLSACTGCNACIVACQSENNIPVVGADQVSRGREMHWLRIDTYYEGDPDDQPDTFHQPVTCMHCEHAPCEPVCPVGATTHSNEGLNEMTYNRCIGTRYCANNCPYKVRRFNFLAYNNHKFDLPVLQMAENPNVTVRSRGVMEKCTYCVQRISSARINAKIDNRPIRDGEVTTACQSVCAANAISFGDLADETSVVAQTKKHPLNYGLLTDLNTRPRTSYLAVVRNQNPALVPPKSEAHHGH